LVGAPELELLKHLSVELMNFTRSLSELLTAALFFAYEIGVLGALETDEVLTVLAFDWIHDNLAAFGTYEILVEFCKI